MAHPSSDSAQSSVESVSGGAHKRYALVDELGNLPDEVSPDEIKRLLDAADDLPVEAITTTNLQRVMTQFEAKVKKNQEMRIKHKDQPEKFLKSEVDLDEEVKKFKQLPASPDLIDLFVSGGGFGTLVAQLSHPNVDVAAEVVGVLEEMTDPEVVAETANPQRFVETLKEQGVPLLIVDVMVKVKEEESPEDADVVSKCLKIVENLIELDSSLTDTLARSTKCVIWLLRRIRATPVDFNRVYASEILNILLQTSESARVNIGRRADQGGVDGIDKLLRTISTHRKRDPDSAEEEEMMWNLFDCLAFLMLVPENRVTFGSAQGVELMIRMLRERKRAYRAALRLTSFALQSCPSNCLLFVEKLGLKSLFGVFMQRVRRGLFYRT
eukprot:GHVN01056090.1.p1 GENE.GHVN01056090.1~~GHVN01056090.1.p1  ORF type:complete len:383 (+),score=74.49 GHVN01056090.1:1693-2841(+)